MDYAPLGGRGFYRPYLDLLLGSQTHRWTAGLFLPPLPG